MSQVLCSLLLGAGYDAYVVAGYAPLSVACNNQSSGACPVLEAEQPKPAKPAPVAATTKQQSLLPKEAKYKIRSDAKMESTFLQVSHLSNNTHTYLHNPHSLDCKTEALFILLATLVNVYLEVRSIHIVCKGNCKTCTTICAHIVTKICAMLVNVLFNTVPAF